MERKKWILINMNVKQCNIEEGSYLPSNRNSPKSERIKNAPLAILISTEQFYPIYQPLRSGRI